MWIDTHCHYAMSRLQDTLTYDLAKAKSRGLMTAIICGTSANDASRITTLAHTYQLHYTLGLHPFFVENPKEQLIQLKQLIQNALNDPLFIGIGEIGLDARYFTADHQMAFEIQLDWAEQWALPITVHSTNCVARVIECIRKHPQLKGVLHAYNGSYEAAKPLLKQGFCLGFGAMLVRPNAKKIHRTFQSLPDAAYVLETDAPDMPLTNQREISTPCDLFEIAQAAAHLRQTSVDTIKQIQFLNACRVFPKLKIP